MTPHDEVLDANEAFYRAFRERDWEGMNELWSHAASVAVIHPGWRTLMGRAAVMQSWAGLFENPRSPRVQCKDATAFLHGDTAFVLCTEDLGEATLVATNIFVLEDDTWRLVHHHAGPGRGAELPDAPASGGGLLN